MAQNNMGNQNQNQNQTKNQNQNQNQNTMGQNQNTTGQGKQGAQAQQQGSRQTGSQAAQTTYWRQQFQNEPYYQAGRDFGDYEPAYNTGELGRAQYGTSGQSFEQDENSLRSDYENSTRGHTNAMKWDEGGKQACKAAWERADSTESRSSQSSDRDMQSDTQQRGSTNTKRQ